MFLNRFNFIILVLGAFVRAHSHIECVKLGTDGKTCQGYGRYYSIYKAGYEGTLESKDRNFIVSPTLLQCPLDPAQGAQEYTEKYPMATVSPGENITMHWPPRGHADQPHSDVWIFCADSSGKKLGRDEIYQGNAEKDEQIDPFHGNDDANIGSLTKIGTMAYSENCQGDDVSWAKCTGSFKIPKDWKEGETRSCMWVWELNQGQRYVDCFDVKVGQASSSESNSQAVSIETNSVSERQENNTANLVNSSVPIITSIKNNSRSRPRRRRFRCRARI